MVKRGGNTLRQNLIYNIIYQVVVVLAPLVVTPKLSRILGADYIGLKSFTFSIVYYFAIFGVLGLDMYGQRCIAQAKNDKERRSRLFFTIGSLRTLLCAISLAIYILAFIAFNFDPLMKTVYLCWAVYLVREMINPVWYLQGTERYKVVSILSILSQLLYVVAVFCFVNSKEDISAYILCYTLIPLITSLIFVPLAFSFIYLGQLFPLDLGALFGLSDKAEYLTWMIILIIYAAAASTLPVWLLLQPRDYLSSYLLYAMLFFGLLGIIFYNPEIQYPAYTGFFTESGKGLFPILFITVACGACSGFHSLVASGTSAKQLDSELDCQPVGYGAMLVEGIVGVIALISVAYFANSEAGPAPVKFASGLAAFGEKLGIPATFGQTFVAMSVSTFLLTSLDTATRLARFMFQEIFEPKSVSASKEVACEKKSCGIVCFLRNMYVATIIVCVLSILLALGAADNIWPVFGSVNQLLAAMTLLVVSLWLIRRKTTPIIAILPLLFMFAVSGSGLFSFAAKVLTPKGALLGGLSILILFLSLVLIFLSILSIIKEYKKRTR